MSDTKAKKKSRSRTKIRFTLVIVPDEEAPKKFVRRVLERGGFFDRPATPPAAA